MWGMIGLGAHQLVLDELPDSAWAGASIADFIIVQSLHSLKILNE